MVIDLGDGVKTNAQLTFPAVGNGPFPGVLLVPGSGNVDMNETVGYVRIDNETGTKIYPPIRPFFQIAEYLSERGFVTLRYDKRGIGENNTILDSNVWGNITSNDLKQDAEKALDVFIQQPEVDANRITVLGHSEGTIIAPRVSIDNPDKVKNLVLMGAVAQNFSKIGEFQVVSLPLLYAKEVLDHTHDGLLSLKEANENPIFSFWAGNLTLILTQNKQLNPKYNTNNDIYLDIDNELKPILLENFKSQSVLKLSEKCTASNPCPIWIKSTYALQPNLNIIGNISSNTSILILQGENETQTPVQQAFLLQQKLTGVGHPDHTLITYPDLGHIFYPSSQWITGAGPIEQYVLRDLYSWLESHNGFTPLMVNATKSSQ
jgi:pimeloyl-ACP methyl ester carboxylesterase